MNLNIFFLIFYKILIYFYLIIQYLIFYDNRFKYYIKFAHKKYDRDSEWFLKAQEKLLLL